MMNYPAKKLKIVFSLFVIIFLWLFYSCSDTEPKVNKVSSYLVFDYQNDSKVDEVRLAVFADAESDVRRVSRIEVESESSSLKWTCCEPEMFFFDGHSWAGSSSFVLPDLKQASGSYTLDYYDALERVYQISFNVVFPDFLLKKSVQELLDYSDSPKTIKMIVLNQDDEIIYYGYLKSSWMEDESEIFKDFNDASLYRKCIIFSEMKTICVLSPVFKQNNDNVLKIKNKNE